MILKVRDLLQNMVLHHNNRIIIVENGEIHTYNRISAHATTYINHTIEYFVISGDDIIITIKGA